jgi:hypothetical protein
VPWTFHNPSGVASWSDRQTDRPPRSLSARKMVISYSSHSHATEVRAVHIVEFPKVLRILHAP